jgi:hypothetical protein
MERGSFEDIRLAVSHSAPRLRLLEILRIEEFNLYFADGF